MFFYLILRLHLVFFIRYIDSYFYLIISTSFYMKLLKKAVIQYQVEYVYFTNKTHLPSLIFCLCHMAGRSQNFYSKQFTYKDGSDVVGKSKTLSASASLITKIMDLLHILFLTKQPAYVYNADVYIFIYNSHLLWNIFNNTS